MIGEPKLEYRSEQRYMGIREKAPFNGMFAVVDVLLKELRTLVKQAGVADEGPFLLRYHVIDMQGMMDIEVGFVVLAHLPETERMKQGVLPAGRYANLVYSRYAMRGNKTLIGWAQQHEIQFDRWDDPEGDAFRCRYEAYLTDYRLEPRKKNWQVDLAIKVAD
jgi:effector-binding domain-containing protein